MSRQSGIRNRQLPIPLLRAELLICPDRADAQLGPGNGSGVIGLLRLNARTLVFSILVALFAAAMLTTTARAG